MSQIGVANRRNINVALPAAASFQAPMKEVCFQSPHPVSFKVSRPSLEQTVKIRHIQTLEVAGLEPYRTLRRPVEHERNGIFVAEGEKVVRRLMESEIEIVSTLLTPAWFTLYESLLESRGPSLQVFVAEKPLLETIVGFNMHQGIMAVGRIPKAPTLGAVLKSTERPHLLAAVDGLTSSENLGVLVRNCAAFGVQALIVGETCTSPYLRRAVRNSMGAIFTLPIINVSSLARSLRDLRSTYSVRTIAAHPRADRKTLYRTDLRHDVCIVFGSEGVGISNSVLEACDESVAVPMNEGIDSLNVASASAVFLSEAVRQRKT